MVKYRVIHIQCGKQIGWYIGDYNNSIVRSKDYVRMDGSSPKKCESLNEFCPHCNVSIKSFAKIFRELSYPINFEENKNASN